MNRYSLAADSRRWWWLPATAGAVGTAVVTAILCLPATGSTSLLEPSPTTGPGGAGAVVERPCYLARRGWNTVRGWEQPVCTTVLDRPATHDGMRGGRPFPDVRP